MRITIVGAGYVGLVAGACYASTGNIVTMIDAEANKVEALRNGDVPIYEPGLEPLLDESVKAGRISFDTDLASAVGEADVIGIAVGTPSREDGSAEMKFVEQAAEEIGRNLRQYAVIVTKSTVPVGTCRRVCEIISSNTTVEFDYVSNPEFLKEGSAVDDFLSPDRVIIGTDSDKARRIMEHLYSPFMRQGSRILSMDPVSAELTKYASNSMLATRISFMNELARLAEAVGADIQQVRVGMGSDSRIGRAFLFPGLGYGGSCFPKDVRALIRTAEELDLPLGVVDAVHRANDRQIDVMYKKIVRYFDGSLAGRKFAMWGLAFKPRTDDMREAPSVKLIGKLLEAGASVAAHDPQAHQTAREILGDRIDYCDDVYQPLDDADGLIICTEWMEFRTPDFKQIARRLKQPVVFDGRNLYEGDYVTEAGLDYICVGRPDAFASR
jgi:UDPglucose 6-dehydrogenase